MSTLAFALAATIKHDGNGGVADLLATPEQAASWLEQHEGLVEEVLGRRLDVVPGAEPHAPANDGPVGDEPPHKPATPEQNLHKPGPPEQNLHKPGPPERDVRESGVPERDVRESGVPARDLRDPDALERDLHQQVRDELVRVRRAVRALFARAVAPEPPSKADADRLMDAAAALRMVNRAADRLGTRHLDWPADGMPVTRWAGRTEDQVALLVGAVGRSTIDFLTGPDRERLRACPAARCVKYFLQDDPRQMWCSPSCGNRERVNRHYRKRQGR